MPELPEVETVRRGLVPVMEGRVIERVLQRRPDLRWPLPERFAERLTGRRVEALRRRSKYLLADLDDGHILLMHLGMSGRLIIRQKDISESPGHFAHNSPKAEKHDHIVLDMQGGAQIIYNDARRFGAMDLFPAEAGHKLLDALGPEPFSNSFNAAALLARCKGRKTSLKALLLDQRIVAGLGNIYVCEALHRAGLSPLRQGAALRGDEAERLVHAIREVLEAAIKAGGSSLRDYRQASGDLGYFQHSFKTYGRTDQPCPRQGCPGAISRIAQSGRSSFYCPECQT